ncbi:MAG TPA: pyridoxal-phosphate dependent enzyme [Vicinamibacterales bacterium]|jgi:threonine dehydratase|nr:pyridoxal-phosphate dependent enzyme [Vicinamibacterales bacterium]
MNVSTWPVAAADVLAARARLQGRVLRSPLRRSDWLSSIAGTEVFLKLESLQPTGSFKIRGAFNAALRHVEREGSRGMVTASAGNHGSGLAYAAQKLGLALTVYAPHDAPQAKLQAILRYGAQLIQTESYDDAERQARASATPDGGKYISPYADEDVIAGAGTVGLEIFEDVPDSATIVVPIGGGGLTSGIGIVARAVRPAARIIGVEAAASTAFSSALAAGRIVPITPGKTLADGLAGNVDPDTPTFAIVRDTVAGVVTVSEAELAAAMRGLALHEHLIAEGAGAAAVAAIAHGKIAQPAGPVVAIVSGANVDVDRLLQVLSGGDT